MATGTRTAPAVNGTPSYKKISIGSMDSDSRVGSVSYNVPNASGTDSNIEAFVAAQQATSGASIYSVEVNDSYVGDADGSNAVDQAKDSVSDNLVVSTKIPNTPNSTLASYIPAPDPDLFITGQDVIDPTSVPLAAFMTATLNLFGGVGRVVQSATFSQRRKSGTKVRI